MLRRALFQDPAFSVARVVCLHLAFLLAWAPFGNLPAVAETAHPTTPEGSNAIRFDSASNEYLFSFRDKVLFRYDVTDHPSLGRSGATFHAVRAVVGDGEAFRPSNAGGITADFGSGAIKPWTNGVSFKRLSTPRVGHDTVVTMWRMSYLSDHIDYELRLSVRGRTLTITVTALEGWQAVTGFNLDRCEGASGARVIRVPYLILFNILWSDLGKKPDGNYTSLFFDWDLSHSSGLEPFSPNNYYYPSPASVSFSQIASYRPKTDGKPNPLQETIYLTVSPDLNDVLPNLPGPVAPLKDLSASRTVVSYNPPFPWLLSPFDPPTYNFIDSIYALGLRNVQVIIKNWQRDQFDHGLPAVLPPNSFDTNVCTGRSLGGHGGLDGLVALRKKIVEDFGYGFALHENYVDYYQEAGPGRFGYDSSDEALLSDGARVTGWVNCSQETSSVLKPSKVEEYARYWSGMIKNAIGPTWSYLDVHSAIDPSNRVDFDARSEGAGEYSYTVQQYRQAASVLRAAYGGPVQGEGLRQMLYAGYFDDFEGRIHTADPTLFGVRVPLLLDFELRKIRPKSTQHGVGHIHTFLNVKRLDTLSVSLFEYIATELAYGHAGLISKNLSRDHSLRQAALENTHVVPMQHAYAGAMPLVDGGILYSDGGPPVYSASQYIALHKDFDDAASSDFMGRVKITYDNGTVVCVNRSRDPWQVSDIGPPDGWYTHNTVDGLDTGKVSATTFTLRPYAGWVCYNPFFSRPSVPALISPLERSSALQLPVILKWDRALGAKTYEVQVATDRDFARSIVFSMADLNTQFVRISDLTDATTYYWRVRASNQRGKGDWSEVGRFSTTQPQE